MACRGHFHCEHLTGSPRNPFQAGLLRGEKIHPRGAHPGRSGRKSRWTKRPEQGMNYEKEGGGGVDWKEMDERKKKPLEKKFFLKGRSTPPSCLEVKQGVQGEGFCRFHSMFHPIAVPIIAHSLESQGRVFCFLFLLHHGLSWQS